MDINELKKQSDKSYSIALAKQNELEKARSKMIMAYDGHLFLADVTTINLVQTLKQHRDEFVVLDSNDNPALIKDPSNFLDRLIAKNQEVLNSYLQAHKKFTERN